MRKDREDLAIEDDARDVGRTVARVTSASVEGGRGDEVLLGARGEIGTGAGTTVDGDLRAVAREKA